MPTLHENGWRQGSVFAAELAAIRYHYANGMPVRTDAPFDRWVVTSQDCDLAAAESDDDASLVEIMPVLVGNAGGQWGLRSRRLRLTSQLYTDSTLPKVRISSSALSVFLGSASVIEPARAVALKTWLGLRYDRPAVPEVLVDLARAIAKGVKATRTPALSEVTYDVLFGATEERPAKFELLGVITDSAHVNDVREWLARAALEVDPGLGSLASAPEALTKAELSIQDVENTYSADVSDITWSKAEPRGAS